MSRDQMLSYSQLSTYLRCRYRWYLSYERMLAPRIDRPHPSLGSAVHAAVAAVLMEHFAYTKSAGPDADLAPFLAGVEQIIARAVQGWKDKATSQVELFEEELIYFDQIADLACGLTLRLIKHLDLSKWETITDRKGVPLIEYQFVVPIAGWGGFRGFIDWVARHKPTGHVWMVDWKVRSSFQSHEAEEVNLQFAAYQYALRRLGIREVAGSIQYQLRDELPKEPKLNKDGTMSRALIRTDWETYRAALVANGLNPDDYLDMYEKLSTVEFFRPIEAYRGPTEIVNVWKQVIQPTAWDMARKKKHLPRNLNPITCNGCEFRQLCLGALRGDDVDWIEQNHYRVKTKPDTGEEEANA